MRHMCEAKNMGEIMWLVADGLDQDWDSLQSEAAASLGCPKKEAMNFWLVNLPPRTYPPSKRV